MKTKKICPICNLTECPPISKRHHGYKTICERVEAYHGYYDINGLNVNEAGRKLFSKLIKQL